MAIRSSGQHSNRWQGTDLPEEGQGEGLAGYVIWVVFKQAGSHEPDGVQLPKLLLNSLHLFTHLIRQYYI